MWQFLDAGTLWWLGAGVPAITILYFLKLRRQDQVVSSTLLWRRSVYDLRVNAPVQMIKRNLLLLLQLIVIALVILALARPFTRLQRAQGRRAAVIIDVSASMGTRDEEDGKTRLAAAKREALRLIDELGVTGPGASDEDELCIIAAADRPVILCGLSSDKGVLRRAVESIGRPRQTRTDMAAALEMAVAVTYVARNLRQLEAGETIRSEGPPPEGEEELIGLTGRNVQLEANVIILSDGVFPEIPPKLADKLAGAPAEDDTGVGAGSRFIPFGLPESDNLAIVAIDLRTDVSGLTNRQLFVRLENMSKKPRKTAVEVSLNGEFLNRQEDIFVPPWGALANTTGEEVFAPGQIGVVFEIPDSAQGVVRVDLETEDKLAVDDSVQALITPPEPIRVLLVTLAGADSYYLNSALDVDARNIAYDVMPSDRYPATGRPKNREGKAYEIIIFDRFSPAEVPPGASLYVDAVPKLAGIHEDQKQSPLYSPVVVDWNRAHPLTRNLALLERIDPIQCRRLVLSGAWTPVVDAQAVLLDSAEELKDWNKVKDAPELPAPLVACLVAEERRL